MALWLVRHAQPLVAPGTCYGVLDLPADDAATAAAAHQLAEVLPQGIEMECSSLQRCEQLAYILCGVRPDLTLKMNPNLVEMDFGNWEGQPWGAIPANALRAWTDDFAHHRPGGGESVSTFMARVARAYDAARARGGDTVWITHAGVIRATGLLHAGVRHIARAGQWPTEGPAFGAWRVLDF
jgi:alpha-ribazole phosphatase